MTAGGNPGASLESISDRCHLREVAFEWELTKESIYLPLGCLQGGEEGCDRARRAPDGWERKRESKREREREKVGERERESRARAG